MKWIPWIASGISILSLYITFFNTVKIAKQRDEATEAAERWMRLYFDVATKLDAVNSSPYPEGMSQAEYFGITPEKAEED